MANTFFARFKGYISDETGAITVDWVVLTSAIVGLGVAVIATVSGGATTYASRLNSEVEKISVVEYD